MPKWIHDRARHILKKNPKMEKALSFAIASQQSHATGKAVKGWGTPEGKAEAKAKYDKPKSEYKQTADPKVKAALALGKPATVSDISQKIKSVKPKSMNAHPKYTNINTGAGASADPGSTIKSSTP